MSGECNICGSYNHVENYHSDPLDAQVRFRKGENEITLDSETSIRVGYIGSEINKGIDPKKILAKGIIEGQEFDLLHYIVINLVD